jgi:hypothetical protein
MTVDQLVEYYPRLYHMATGGSWPTIQRHGLMPTAYIVTTSGLPSTEQAQLLTQRRPASVVLTHPTIGRVTVRDQAPLRQQFLDLALTDMTEGEWLTLLNDRVFFWLHQDKLHRLLVARRYRSNEQDVLTVDTGRLVEAYENKIRLSPINSGATLYPNAPQRGSGTFLPIDQYPFTERRRGRTPSEAITELAVIDGVPDLANFVISVEKRRGADLLESLYP